MSAKRIWFSSWTAHQGFALGLNQSAVHTRVRVSRKTNGLIGLLDRELGAVFKRTSARGEMVGPEALVEEVLFWIKALQRECRVPTSDHAFVLATAEVGAFSEFTLGIPTTNANATVKCAEWIENYFDLDEPARPPASSLLPQFYEDMKRFGEKGLNRFYFAEAALRQKIPVYKIGPVYALGLGKNSRLLFSSLTDRTSALGAKVANSKLLCSRTLQAAGFPVPQNAFVKTPDDAVAAAARIGFPVVVKPSDTDRGIGVSANLPDATRVKRAFVAAQSISNQILVESHIFGATHRLTVFEDKVVRISKRVAGGVTGDGVRSIRELVAASQALVQKSGRIKISSIGAISLDEEALDLMAQNGYSPDSVPELGSRVVMRRRDNVNAGGTNETIALATAHPDNLELAVSVARFLRMDFAGIDLISLDITQSWRDNGASICEVNSMPQFGVLDVSEFYEDCVRSLVPNGGKIEVSLYISCDEAATVERLLQEDKSSSISAKSGIWINGKQSAKPFSNAYAAAAAAFLRPEIGEIKCVMSPQDVLRYGLACPNIDHLHVCDDQEAMQDERNKAVAAVQLHMRRSA